MKAKVKGRYEANKNNASATLSLNISEEFIVKATMTDATFVSGPSLTGLQLSLHKPNSFCLRYDVPRKNASFKFMNKVKIMDKIVNLSYLHAQGEHQQTSVEGYVTFDPSNRVLVGYNFDSNDWKVKYVYAHELSRTVIEPSFDVSKNAWDFSVSKKLESGNSIRAMYHALHKDLMVEWRKISKINGSFKISASVNMTGDCRTPCLKAQSAWNYEI